MKEEIRSKKRAAKIKVISIILLKEKIRILKICSLRNFKNCLSLRIDMLYLVGLGISGDLTLGGLEVVRKANRIYYESYTSLIDEDFIRKLEKLAGKKFEKVERRDLEDNVKSLLEQAKESDICILIPGDPLIATTHISIILEAENLGIKYQVIHNSSIFPSICEVGIQIYKIGRITSIPLKEENFNPESFYEVIEDNLKRGLHTVILLEARSEREFVSINEAVRRILELSEERNGTITPKSLGVGISRLGFNDSIIKFGKLEELETFNFGKPPHTLLILGKLHFVEEEALKRFR